MEKCKQFRQWIWLAVYDELPANQKKMLEGHIQNCSECQLDYQEVEQTVKLLDQKIQLEPTDPQLETSRAELHQRLLFLTQPNYLKKWIAKLWEVVSLDFAPALRFATAAALLLIGLFLGRIFFGQESLNFEPVQKQVADLTESNISNIQSIQYDPSSRQVTIKLSTVNDVMVHGNVETPEIQQLLTQALMVEERPDIRLKTVRALQETKTLDKNIIKALSELINKEENPGIRLKAVKLLTSIPITPLIKEMLTQVLVRVLLNDSNSAIRIEAFKGLSKIENGSVAPVILNAAKRDSSDYIQSKAKQLLERTKNPVFPTWTSQN